MLCRYETTLPLPTFSKLKQNYKAMKQVKFLNEADRPKEEKPMEYTEWCKQTKRTARLENDYSLNVYVKQYATYLSSFPTEKKKVEFTHYLNHKGSWSDDPCDPQDAGDVVYLGKDNVEGDVFCVKTVDYVLIFKGHLNSSYY